jgi:hypothetical protein
MYFDKVPGRRFGFDELMGGYFALKEAVPGIEISFGTREGLDLAVKDAIEEQAVRIF